MKTIILCALASGLCFTAAAKTIYLTPEVNIRESLGLLEPGDSLAVHAGTYRVRPEDISRLENQGPYAIVFDLSMSGEKGNPIIIKGMADDEGRRPVFDFSGVTLRDEANPEGYRIVGFLITGSYLYISDLECIGLQVTRTDHTQSENFRITGGSYNTLENVVCRDGMGIGVYINGDSHHNLILNCDAYNNYDSVSDISMRTGEPSGGNNDGFGCHVSGGMSGNKFIGCRAWRNTDDGFDLINCYSPTSISYCIAMENGFDSNGVNRADGNGVKGGGFGMRPRDIPLYNGESPRHSICNNVAFANKSHGIYSNHHLGGIDFHSNTSICNGRANYSMVNRKGSGKEEKVDVDGYGHALSGNLSLSSDGRHYLWIDHVPNADEIVLTDISEKPDHSVLYAPRLADGSLPSDLIEFIQSFRKEYSGADFDGYYKAVAESRRFSGCYAE